MKDEEVKKSNHWYLVLLICLIFGFIAGWIYKTTRSSSIKERLLPISFGSHTKSSFSCETKFGATIFPEQSYESDEETIHVEGNLSRGGSSIAIKVENEIMSLITSTAVEIGEAEPSKFEIIENSDQRLKAVFADEGLSGSSINTFMLDKNTGYAIWTKASASSLIPDLPNGQVYYLNCL
ncbi:MAG: hypothetical protein ABFQ62_03650 [Patescibacteria group bacterium]